MNGDEFDFSREGLSVWHMPVTRTSLPEEEFEERSSSSSDTTKDETTEKEEKKKSDVNTPSESDMAVAARIVAQRANFAKILLFAAKYSSSLRMIDLNKGIPENWPLEAANTDGVAREDFITYPIALLAILDKLVVMESPVHFVALICPVVAALKDKARAEAMAELRDPKMYPPYFAIMAEMWINRDKVTPRMLQEADEKVYRELSFGPHTKEMMILTWTFTVLYKADLCLQLEQLQRQPPRHWDIKTKLWPRLAQWRHNMGRDDNIPMPLLKRLYTNILNGHIPGKLPGDKQASKLWLYPRPATAEEKAMWAKMTMMLAVSGAPNPLEKLREIQEQNKQEVNSSDDSATNAFLQEEVIAATSLQETATAATI